MPSSPRRRKLLSFAGSIIAVALVVLAAVMPGQTDTTGAWFAASTTLTGNTAKTGVLSAPGTLRNSWSSSTGNTLSWDSATSQPWATANGVTSGINYRLTRHVGSYPALDLYNGPGTSFTDPNPVQRQLRYTQVSAAKHQLALDENGYVWAWGTNDRGQLGNNTTTPSTSAALVTLPAGRTAKQVMAGQDFSAALLDDGTLWTWGWNYYGQLGIGNNTNQLLPQRVIFPAGVGIAALGQISGADPSMYIIDNNGAIWAWGYNNVGQLGDGTTIATNIPHVIPNLRVSSVVATGGHVMALGKDGAVWSWGANNLGQVGDHSTTARLTPYRVLFPAAVTPIIGLGSTFDYSMVLEANGAIWVWGKTSVNGVVNPSDPTVIPTPALPAGVKPIQLKGYNERFFAVLSNGALLERRDTNGGQMFYTLILDGHFIKSLDAIGTEYVPATGTAISGYTRENYYALTADTVGSGLWWWTSEQKYYGPWAVATPLICPYMTKISGSSCTWDGLLSYSVDYSYGPWRSDFSGLKL